MRALRPRPLVALGAAAATLVVFDDRDEGESRGAFLGASSHSEDCDDSVSVVVNDPEQVGDCGNSSGEDGADGASAGMAVSIHSKAMSASSTRVAFSSILPTNRNSNVTQKSVVLCYYCFQLPCMRASRRSDATS